MTPTWIKLLKGVIANVESGYFAKELEALCPYSSKAERSTSIGMALESVFKTGNQRDWCNRLNPDYIARKAAALLFLEKANNIEWHNRLNGEE